MGKRSPHCRLFLLFVVCALWAYIAYSWDRTRSGPIGFSPGRIAGTTLKSLVVISLWPFPCIILPPFVVSAPAVVAAVIWWRHVRFEWWLRQQPTGTLCCRGCGYPATGLGTDVCPECGSADFGVAARNRVGYWRPAALLTFVGWILGCAAAEAVLVTDELRFQQEAMASGQAYLMRHRRWTPHFGELVYDGTRFWCVDD